MFDDPKSLMQILDFEMYLQDKLVVLDKDLEEAKKEYQYFLDIKNGKVISHKSYNDTIFTDVKLDIVSEKIDHILEMTEKLQSLLDSMRK
jgi:hypothetical protein